MHGNVEFKIKDLWKVNFRDMDRNIGVTDSCSVYEGKNK